MTAPANPWTPKPWLVAGTTVYAVQGSKISLRNRFTALVQPSGRNDTPASEVEANATLMGAAPDLYDALSEALSELDDKMHSHMSQEEFEAHPTISTIRAALSKARGETL